MLKVFPKKKSKKLGSFGEHLVCKFLSSKGYTLICKNYKTKNSEIDLIFEFEDWIIFVEVKAYHIKSSFSPYSSLTSKKRKSLLRGIDQWLFDNNQQGAQWRLDLAIVHLGQNRIEHFENIQI